MPYFLLARGIEQPPQHPDLPHGPPTSPLSAPSLAAARSAIQFGIFGKERIRFGIELDGKRRKGRDREGGENGQRKGGVHVLSEDPRLQRATDMHTHRTSNILANDIY